MIVEGMPGWAQLAVVALPLGIVGFLVLDALPSSAFYSRRAFESREERRPLLPSDLDRERGRVTLSRRAGERLAIEPRREVVTGSRRGHGHGVSWRWRGRSRW